MTILINWILSALVIFVLSNILPGVHVNDFLSALIVALVLGIINAFIKPVILILTLPINIVTLGLFTLVINAFLIMVTGYIVAGFRVDGFLSALIFSIALSIVNMFFGTLKSSRE